MDWRENDLDRDSGRIPFGGMSSSTSEISDARGIGRWMVKLGLPRELLPFANGAWGYYKPELVDKIGIWAYNGSKTLGLLAGLKPVTAEKVARTVSGVSVVGAAFADKIGGYKDRVMGQRERLQKRTKDIAPWLAATCGKKKASIVNLMGCNNEVVAFARAKDSRLFGREVVAETVASLDTLPTLLTQLANQRQRTAQGIAEENKRNRRKGKDTKSNDSGDVPMSQMDADYAEYQQFLTRNKANGDNVGFTEFTARRDQYDQQSTKVDTTTKGLRGAAEKLGKFVNVLSSGSSLAFNSAADMITDRAKNEHGASCAFDMIVRLNEEVGQGKERIEDVDGKPMAEYVAQIFEQNELDHKRKVHKRDRAALVKMLQPVAEQISRGFLSPLALFSLVGEHKLMKQGGRVLAGKTVVESEVKRMVELLPNGAQTDITAFFEDVPFAMEDIKKTLTVLKGEERAVFVMSFPRNIMLTAGLTEPEIKREERLGRRVMIETVGAAYVDLNALSDAELEKRKNSPEDIATIRELASIAKEGKETLRDHLDENAAHMQGALAVLRNNAMTGEVGTWTRWVTQGKTEPKEIPSAKTPAERAEAAMERAPELVGKEALKAEPPPPGLEKTDGAASPELPPEAPHLQKLVSQEGAGDQERAK